MDREPRAEDSSLYARVLQRLTSALQEAVLPPPPVWEGSRAQEDEAPQLSPRARLATIVGLNLVLWTLIIGSAALIL